MKIITDEKELQEAIQHIASETAKMAMKITNAIYPIGSLTVFSHEQDEFENLKKILLSWGTQFKENNGPYVELREPIKLENGELLRKVRVRNPDSERPQVGCNDFIVEDYEAFKQSQTPAHPENLIVIPRPEYEMIEFRDPEFDVLAYVLNK